MQPLSAMDTLPGSTGSTEVAFATRVSARGVISGLLVGLALEATLLVLGAAIGLSALRPGGSFARGLGIGFAVWLLVTLLCSAFVAAWIASAAARAVRRRDGVLHGVVTWGAFSLVGLSLVGNVVSGSVGSLFTAIANASRLSDGAFEAVHHAGLGSWGMFLALMLPLFAAIGGGAVAAGRERRVVGLPDERARRSRKPMVASPRHTAQVPTRPIPAT
jgi:hypothetical protein